MQAPVAAADTLYDQVLVLVGRILARAAEGQGIEDLPLRDVVRGLNEHLRHSHDLLMCLHRPPSEDQFLETHVVNTCLLTLTLAQGLGLPDDEIALLGMCALLYDVGLARLLRNPPAQVPGGASPVFHDMRRHPELGAECLRAMQVQLERAPHVTAQHHERIDGSGYPSGLKGHAIDWWAQIVGLADLYESFTHPRAQRQHHRPQAHDCLRELITGNGLFDQRLIKVLLNQISLYPVGTWVKLYDGGVGRVCGINQGLPLRPIVELYRQYGQLLNPPRRINLKDYPTVTIRGTTSPDAEGIVTA